VEGFQVGLMVDGAYRRLVRGRRRHLLWKTSRAKPKAWQVVVGARRECREACVCMRE
jgi:uncharacterized protein YbdZ (MbtH family)